MLTVIRSSTLAALYAEIDTLSADNARLRDLMARLTAASATLLELMEDRHSESAPAIIIPPGGMVA